MKCSCEEFPESQYGSICNTERLVRVVSDKHFRKSGQLKPSAFPLSHVQRSGLSLVRADKIDLNEMSAVADDIIKLSRAKEARGALLAHAAEMRSLKDKNDERALCVKDDPVRGEDGVRDNEAHAIILASGPTDENDGQAIRDWLMTTFSHAQQLADLYGGAKEENI